VPAVQAASAAPALPFAWSRAVWELALRHRNLQVQRMALRSLLKRHWPPELLATVPAEFWTATLFPALLVPMHHRPSAAQRMPSEQDGGSTMTAAALTSATVAGSLPGPRLDLDVVAETSLILADWVAAAGPAPARDMLHDALALLAGSGRQELPRTGALALLQCLAAAAATSDTHDGLEGASGPRLLLLQDLLPGCAGEGCAAWSACAVLNCAGEGRAAWSACAVLNCVPSSLPARRSLFSCALCTCPALSVHICLFVFLSSLRL
jgi:hypothetical protein